MQNTCASAKLITPVPGQLGQFDVYPPLGELPNSFFINFESDTIAQFQYLFFDGNEIAAMSITNAIQNFTYGASADPTAAAVGGPVNQFYRRLTGSTPMILKSMRIVVTSGEQFEGTITQYTSSISGDVASKAMDITAAINPANNQRNVLDFFMPENFILDGFVGFGILLPITTAVQTYTATFEISGIADRYTMESPCRSACDIKLN